MKEPTTTNEATLTSLLTSDGGLRAECEKLLEQARLLAPEAEVFEPEKDYTMEELALLRSRLSTMRKSIDFINKGLAIYWQDEYKGESYQDEYNIWWVGTTKGKRIVDADMFYAWLATKDADELSKLVSPSAVKVGGMSPVERSTHLDETPRNTDVSINNKPRG